MVHSVSGWTRDVQLKLWDLLRTRSIPEHLRGVFTNPRLPYLTCLAVPMAHCFILSWNTAAHSNSAPVATCGYIYLTHTVTKNHVEHNLRYNWCRQHHNGDKLRVGTAEVAASLVTFILGILYIILFYFSCLICVVENSWLKNWKMSNVTHFVTQRQLKITVQFWHLISEYS